MLDDKRMRCVACLLHTARHGTHIQINSIPFFPIFPFSIIAMCQIMHGNRANCVDAKSERRTLQCSRMKCLCGMGEREEERKCRWCRRQIKRAFAHIICLYLVRLRFLSSSLYYFIFFFSSASIAKSVPSSGTIRLFDFIHLLRHYIDVFRLLFATTAMHSVDQRQTAKLNPNRFFVRFTGLCLLLLHFLVVHCLFAFGHRMGNNNNRTSSFATPKSHVFEFEWMRPEGDKKPINFQRNFSHVSHIHP